MSPIQLADPSQIVPTLHLRSDFQKAPESARAGLYLHLRATIGYESSPEQGRDRESGKSISDHHRYGLTLPSAILATGRGVFVGIYEGD